MTGLLIEVLILALVLWPVGFLLFGWGACRE